MKAPAGLSDENSLARFEPGRANRRIMPHASFHIHLNRCLLGDDGIDNLQLSFAVQTGIFRGERSRLEVASKQTTVLD